MFIITSNYHPILFFSKRLEDGTDDPILAAILRRFDIVEYSSRDLAEKVKDYLCSREEEQESVNNLDECSEENLNWEEFNSTDWYKINLKNVNLYIPYSL